MPGNIQIRQLKLLLEKNTDITQFEKFIDKLYASNVAELKVVENFAIQEAEEFDGF